MELCAVSTGGLESETLIYPHPGCSLAAVFIQHERGGGGGGWAGVTFHILVWSLHREAVFFCLEETPVESAAAVMGFQPQDGRLPPRLEAD